MIGEALYREIVKSRPVGDDKFLAGCVCHVGNGRYHIEFIMYWNRGGIAGRLTPREVAAIAPGLVDSMRHHGDELRAYLVAEDARLAAGFLTPGGVGSSRPGGRQKRTREGAGIRDCNGATGSGYARGEAVLASPVVPGAAGSGAVDGPKSGPDGGFARDSRLTARYGKREGA